MTHEYAAYFRLLLLCGYTDELEQYIDSALVEQDPISDIILELSTAGNNSKKILSVLNEYLLEVCETDIDYDKTVFSLILSFLQRKYQEDSCSLRNITDLMYRIARCSDRYFDDPWHTMYIMGDLFEEAENGYLDRESFQHSFDHFLYDGICTCDFPPALPGESLFRRLYKKLFSKF